MNSLMGFLLPDIYLSTIFEQKCDPAVPVNRSGVQERKPQFLVPFFQYQRLLLECGNKNPKFPFPVYSLRAFLRDAGQLFNGFLVAFDQAVVFPVVLLLGLLPGGVVLDALADQFRNHLDFLVETVNLLVQGGKITDQHTHILAGF